MTGGAQLVELKRGEHGAHLRPAHFRPGVAEIVWVMGETAPDLEDETLWVTDAWRPPRAGRPSYHPACAAFDFRVHNIKAESDPERLEKARQWVQRARVRLTRPFFDVILHGEGANLHIHVEMEAQGPL